MKILFLPSYFYPESYSSAHLDKDLYEYFSSVGIRMIAYAPMPSRGVLLKTRKAYYKKKVEYLFQGFFELHRFPIINETNYIFLRAIRYIVSALIQLLKGLFTNRIDVIFLVSTPPIIGIVGGLLYSIRKVPFVYVVQDIFPDSLVNTGLSKKGSLAWNMGRMIENFSYRNATRIIVISQDFKNNLLKKDVPEGKIEVIYNWIDTKSISPIRRQENRLITAWNLNSSYFYVVYAGNFGNAQSVETIIQSAKLLQNECSIQFLLIGGGSQEKFLKKLVNSNKIKNVKFFPFQPFEMSSDVFSIGDIGIVCCKKGMGKNAFPSKTWSYLAAGTPIIASYDLDSELAQMVSLNGFGIAINPENANEMAAAILQLKNKDKMLREMSITARYYVEANASKEKAMDRYLQVIKSVISGG